MKVAIGSKNPVKINCVTQAFLKVWPNEAWEFEGVEVTSGVSDQPMSDEESIRGGRTRAKKALEALNADYGAGLESGLQQIGDLWFECGWVVIRDRKGREGIGSTTRMQTPEKMVQMVREGMELGDVTDVLFGTKNSKQQNGHFGIMTNNSYTRTDSYRDGVIFALARFLHPEVFEK